MELLPLIILAIVQGISEFLPVSSSGHLVVAGELLAEFGYQMMEEPLLVSILLHAGTLGAILLFYWKDICQVLTTNRQLIGPIIVGTIPVGVVGVVLKKLLSPEADAAFESGVLTSPVVSGVMFLVTAGLLIFSARRKAGDTELPQVSYRQALAIGVIQSLAVLPGLSRSGSTIAAGLVLGLNRQAAATFSFLLAIPAIGGVSLIQILDLIGGETSVSGSAEGINLAIATFVSFAVGLVSLCLLVRLVLAGKLQYFAYYLIPLGLAMIAWKGFGLFG